MSRSEELRAEAAEEEAIEAAAATYEAALKAYREKPNDDTRAAYRAAASELDELRTAAITRRQGGEG